MEEQLLPKDDLPSSQLEEAFAGVATWHEKHKHAWEVNGTCDQYEEDLGIVDNNDDDQHDDEDEVLQRIYTHI